MQAQSLTFWIATSLSLLAMTSGVAGAAINIPFTINMSEAVTVTGTPRIAIDVGGNTRYATYTSGTGTNALTFTLSPNIGDVDLDGVTVSSPIDLNGGTIKDASGNDATLTFTPPNTAGIKVNYPSLGMDFTNGTSGRYTLNGTVYNDISSFLTASGGTFSRNSIATYFDSTGILQTASANTPRFDYDPVTHQPKGLLIEESRTNLLTYSNMSTTTGWGGSNLSILTVNNPGSLPVGASACLRDEVNTGQSSGFAHKILSLSPNTPYTFSAWVYIPSTVPAGRALIASWYNNAGWQVISSDFITERDQWVRKTHSFITNATYPTTIVGAGLSSATPGLQSYVCLAQLEAGSFPTSYIPTTTAAVTRDADTLSIPTGSWFHSTNGTLFSQVSTPTTGSSVYRRTVSINSGAVSDSISLILTHPSAGSVKLAEIQSGGINQFSSSTSAYSINTDIKQALLYDTNYALSASDGLLGTVDTTIDLPNVTTLNIGNHSNTNPRYLNGTVAKIKYYPLRTNDTQLQLLTQ